MVLQLLLVWVIRYPRVRGSLALRVWISLSVLFLCDVIRLLRVKAKIDVCLCTMKWTTFLALTVLNLKRWVSASTEDCGVLSVATVQFLIVF